MLRIHYEKCQLWIVVEPATGSRRLDYKEMLMLHDLMHLRCGFFSEGVGLRKKQMEPMKDMILIPPQLQLRSAFGLGVREVRAVIEATIISIGLGTELRWLGDEEDGGPGDSDSGNFRQRTGEEWTDGTRLE